MGFALSMRNAMPSVIRDFISEHLGINRLIVEKLLFADSDLGFFFFCERQYALLSVCRTGVSLASLHSPSRASRYRPRVDYCFSQAVRLADTDSTKGFSWLVGCGGRRLAEPSPQLAVVISR